MNDEPEPGLHTVAVDDPEHLAAEASRRVLAAIRTAIAERGIARVVLAGGTTPRATHRLLAAALAREGTEVARIAWYFGDERWVPVGDPQSNEGMARETLLAPLSVSESAIHSWQPGSGDPVACAARYAEQRVAERVSGGRPDVLLLGMGADGHTASLFPGATACFTAGRESPIGPGLAGTAAAVPGDAPRGGQARQSWSAHPRGVPGQAQQSWSAHPRGWRLTLCPDFLNTSRVVLFLVSGADKAPALLRARSGDPATPAAWIRGESTYFIATRDALGPENPNYGQRFARA